MDAASRIDARKSQSRDVVNAKGEAQTIVTDIQGDSIRLRGQY